MDKRLAAVTSFLVMLICFVCPGAASKTEFPENLAPKPRTSANSEYGNDHFAGLVADRQIPSADAKSDKPGPLPVIDFPLVDYHVHLKGGLTLDEAIEISKKNGVKFGIAQNCGFGFPVTDDEGAKRFIKELRNKPVYVGMQAEGREWLKLFSKEVIAEFDYVLTDALTFTDNNGRRTRLWMKDEVHIDDKQAFMDMYVDKIVAIISNEPIDIFANATFLPDVIAAEYDTLWTKERAGKVIDAAVKNKVAIEINARYHIPSPAFIRQAKKAGAKFSLGTNNGDKELGSLEYCRRMIKECGLTKKDFFAPRPPGQKPVQRPRPAD
jgi:histidinol phosphatase-like PHP family hydrolase